MHRAGGGPRELGLEAAGDVLGGAASAGRAGGAGDGVSEAGRGAGGVWVCQTVEEAAGCFEDGAGCADRPGG